MLGTRSERLNESVTEKPVQTKFLIQCLILSRVFEGVWGEGAYAFWPKHPTLVLFLLLISPSLKTSCKSALFKHVIGEDLLFQSGWYASLQKVR